MSGPEAIAIAEKVFRSSRKRTLSKCKSHTLSHGWLEHHGQHIDEVMVAVYREPASYTAEDIVEIIGHGGYATLRATLNALLEHGARLADPGEFTKRAFLNGKMDLAQAEAVMDIIVAKNDRSLETSLARLQGGLSRWIGNLRQEILFFYAPLEAAIDFPEEDIEAITTQELQTKILLATNTVARLLESLEGSRAARDGLQVALIGRPNAGKSSLFNAILIEDKALVTDIPGTTRDSVEAQHMHKGYSLHLIDTAGIREGAGKVESYGIARSLEKSQGADIVLYLIDRSKRIAGDIKSSEPYKLRKDNTIVVFTKIDLPARLSKTQQNQLSKGYASFQVSALTGQGLSSLKDGIVSTLQTSAKCLGGADVSANTRQILALGKTKESLERAYESCMQDQSYEVIAMDISGALGFLGEITGETASEELLHEIFSRFCIGK
jgi:tRNA modification GTPase